MHLKRLILRSLLEIRNDEPLAVKGILFLTPPELRIATSLVSLKPWTCQLLGCFRDAIKCILGVFVGQKNLLPMNAHSNQKFFCKTTILQAITNYSNIVILQAWWKWSYTFQPKIDVSICVQNAKKIGRTRIPSHFLWATRYRKPILPFLRVLAVLPPLVLRAHSGFTDWNPPCEVWRGMEDCTLQIGADVTQYMNGSWSSQEQ